MNHELGTKEISDTPPQRDETTPRRRFFRWAFLAVAVFLIIAGSFVLVEIYVPRIPDGGTIVVEIRGGAGAREIARTLERHGVIRFPSLFVAYVALYGETEKLKPGIYSFYNLSLENVAGTLVRGGGDEISITIPEGWSSREIGSYFEGRGIFSAKAWNDFAAHPPKLFADEFPALFDKPSGAGLEGYLFPDTYRIFRSGSVEDAARKILLNFEKKFTAELREEARRQKKTIFEIITMASLIEGEVVSDEDRAVVSGILWKRLGVGIALQVDATVVYITGKKTTRISRAELEIDSPYNTYKYPGLPAGPIGNPGISAIRAALWPKLSPYLYYLSAPGGETVFSRTLDEHNRAKAEYLR